MHATYTFDFLTTVSNQLIERLDSLSVTWLTDDALLALSEFQTTRNSAQGVYLLHEGDAPRYLGKAKNVHVRLRQHLRKLSGRQNINLQEVGYKALLLDNSMSTAANEELLIEMYEGRFDDMWNGGGFGTKDPGKNRDTTVPGKFDQEHRIIRDFPVENIQDQETISSLFNKMKRELPYLFRSAIGDAKSTSLDLTGVERNAESLLRAALQALPSGMHAAILAYGMVAYNNAPRHYPLSVVVIPSGSQ